MIKTQLSGLKLSLLVLCFHLLLAPAMLGVARAVGGRWAGRQGGDLLPLLVTEISHPTLGMLSWSISFAEQ